MSKVACSVLLPLSLALHALPGARSSDSEEMEILTFKDVADVNFDAEPLQDGLPPKQWTLKEHRQTSKTTFKKSDFVKSAKLYMVERILEPDEVEVLLSILGDVEFSRAREGVDGLPSHQIRVGSKACEPFCPPHGIEEKLFKVITPAVNTRLLPYVRHRYKCENCAVCSIAFRRYVAGEVGQRSSLPTHYDESHYITAEIGLDVQGLKYDGGLYVEDDGGRQVVPLKTGDALFHQFDLAKGVDVTDGRRTALIVQFQDASDCTADYTSWYRKAAKKGDPVAKYQLGQLYMVGTKKAEQNLTRSAIYLDAALKQGYQPAAVPLAGVLLRGNASSASKEAEAIEILKIAAEDGDAHAALALGQHYVDANVNHAEAVRLITKAAETPHSLPVAQYTLGNLYLSGMAVEKDMQKAIQWWRKAGERGFAAAQSNLGAYHLNEVLDAISTHVVRADLEKRAAEAERWLRPAAASDDPNAMYALAVLLLKHRNRVEEALPWLKKAKDAGHEEAKKEFEAVQEFKVGADKKKAKTRAVELLV